jgi:hypothetical protein
LAVLSPLKLIGRGDEVAALDRAYRRASGGELRALLLVAEAGVGKTRLAREFLGRKRDQAILLPARAHALGATASFGVWAEAFEHHLRGLPPEDVGRLCGGFLDDLEPCFGAPPPYTARRPRVRPPRRVC